MAYKIKVALNGYGTIGKRVADAVMRQDDMTLVGIAKTKPDYEAYVAANKGYPIYAADPAKAESKFRAAGLSISGSNQDMIKKADIIVDCAPEGIGEENKKLYEQLKKPAIFQGGEEHEVAGTPFNVAANYNEAVGKQFVRVVSCNTTGLCRLLYAKYPTQGMVDARVNPTCQNFYSKSEMHITGNVILSFQAPVESCRYDDTPAISSRIQTCISYPGIWIMPEDTSAGNSFLVKIAGCTPAQNFTGPLMTGWTIPWRPNSLSGPDQTETMMQAGVAINHAWPGLINEYTIPDGRQGMTEALQVSQMYRTAGTALSYMAEANGVFVDNVKGRPESEISVTLEADRSADTSGTAITMQGFTGHGAETDLPGEVATGKKNTVSERKARSKKTSTITFNELIQLLVFLLLFALVIYAMGKGLDPERLFGLIGDTFARVLNL